MGPSEPPAATTTMPASWAFSMTGLSPDTLVEEKLMMSTSSAMACSNSG
jgi:hypothetical protein